MTSERCKFCNRKLKDPKSQVAGFGPTCAEKHGLTVRVIVTKRSTAPAAVYSSASDFF